MKRILRVSSVVGVLGVTAWLIYSLINNFGNSFLGYPKVESLGYPKVESLGYPKVESLGYPKVESLGYPKVEFLGYPKVESLGYPKIESEPETSFMPNCDPFGGMDLSVVILSIREDIMVLPLYLKTEGDLIPGLVSLDDTPPVEFHALLGDIKSNSCGLQGFDDRLYCMFTVTPDMPGSVVNFYLYKKDCEDPCFTQLNLSIPELQPAGEEKSQCKKNMGPKKCEAAGGTMSTDLTKAPYCICP